MRTEELWNGINSIDKTSNLSRGLIMVQAGQSHQKYRVKTSLNQIELRATTSVDYPLQEEHEAKASQTDRQNSSA